MSKKKSRSRAMKVVSVHLPEEILDAIDYYVNRKLFPNRAELVRFAVKQLLRRLKKHETHIM